MAMIDVKFVPFNATKVGIMVPNKGIRASAAK